MTKKYRKQISEKSACDLAKKEHGSDRSIHGTFHPQVLLELINEMLRQNSNFEEKSKQPPAYKLIVDPYRIYLYCTGVKEPSRDRPTGIVLSVYDSAHIPAEYVGDRCTDCVFYDASDYSSGKRNVLETFSYVGDPKSTEGHVEVASLLALTLQSIRTNSMVHVYWVPEAGKYLLASRPPVGVLETDARTPGEDFSDDLVEFLDFTNDYPDKS